MYVHCPPPPPLTLAPMDREGPSLRLDVLETDPNYHYLALRVLKLIEAGREEGMLGGS